jgi:hypothetical protein
MKIGQFQLRGSFFCNIHNKNIYNENWTIPAALQQFSVRRNISVTVLDRTLIAVLAGDGVW